MLDASFKNMVERSESPNMRNLVIDITNNIRRSSFFQERGWNLEWVGESLRIGIVGLKALLGQVALYFNAVNVGHEIFVLAYGACWSAFHIGFDTSAKLQRSAVIIDLDCEARTVFLSGKASFVVVELTD